MGVLVCILNRLRALSVAWRMAEGELLTLLLFVDGGAF